MSKRKAPASGGGAPGPKNLKINLGLGRGRLEVSLYCFFVLEGLADHQIPGRGIKDSNHGK